MTKKEPVESILIKFLETQKNSKFRIIGFLIENKGLDVSKKDIIESGVSRASLFRVWKQLEEQEIVLVMKNSVDCVAIRQNSPDRDFGTKSNKTNQNLCKRKFGKTKLYVLNTKNPIIKKLLELESIMIGKALERQHLVEITA